MHTVASTGMCVIFYMKYFTFVITKRIRKVLILPKKFILDNDIFVSQVPINGVKEYENTTFLISVFDVW